MRKTNDYKGIASDLIQFLLRLEWVWIAIMILAFWHVSPPIRDNYVFLLTFAIPIYSIRWLVYRRLWTRTPLDILFLIFAVLTVYNFHNAPISRADYWVLVCRPFLGILLVWYVAETVRQNGHLRHVIVVTIILGIIVGTVALTASQWGASDKSDLFAFLLDHLPRLDHQQVLPDMQLSFNPNEIAGALAYFAPFLLAISIGSFVNPPSPANTIVDRVSNGMMRWGAMLGFLLVWSALFLGQSRFGLAGAFVGLLVVILFVIPRWKYRLIGLTIWGIVVILEIMIVTNVFPLDLSPANPTQSSEPASVTILDERDERTLSARFDLWERALRMVQDYPTTGAGMSTYRALVMRDEYMIPLYEERRFGPPHAHNALFQMGADLGVMGLVLFIGWYAVIAWIAVQSYRNTNLNSKMLTIAMSSSILSYIGYGVGDTITLWDRFAFLHWWFMALMVGVYLLNKYSPHTISSTSE